MDTTRVVCAASSDALAQGDTAAEAAEFHRQAVRTFEMSNEAFGVTGDETTASGADEGGGGTWNDPGPTNGWNDTDAGGDSGDADSSSDGQY